MTARWLFGPLAAVLMLAAAGSAQAAPPSAQRLTPAGSGSGVTFVASSPDGSRVVFLTGAALLPADTDTRQDVYESNDGVLALLSTGSGGGNGAFDVSSASGTFGASQDASHVFFETAEPLSASDGDAKIDVYEHDATGTHLRTGAGNGAFDARFVRGSDDGSQVFFRTNEQIPGAGDTDSATDLYRRTDTSTTLLGDVSAIDAWEWSLSHDGTRMVFQSIYPFGGDGDGSPTGAMDVFARDQSGTTWLSSGPQNADEFTNAIFRGASRAAHKVVFETDSALVASDDDTASDLYQNIDGDIALVAQPDAVYPGPDAIPQFDDISDSGGTVMFSTPEKLTAGDDDGKVDVFVLQPTLLGPWRHLVSSGLSGGQGPFDAEPAALSRDGSHAYFTTAEALRDTDDDGTARDVYENDGTTTRLVSTGPADAGEPVSADYVGSSPDGARAYFTTMAKLVSEDTDSAVDLYVREAGTTTLLSLGSGGGNGAFDVQTRKDWVSADGSHVFFASVEGLDDGTATGWNLYAAGAPAVAPPAPDPTPTPAPAPAPVPVAIKDTVRPKLSLALVKGQALKSVLKAGALRLRVGCDEACRIGVVLELAGARSSAAKKLRLGSLSVKLPAKGTKVVRVKLTNAGKAALRRARRSPRIAVRLTATDAAGNRGTRTATVTVRR